MVSRFESGLIRHMHLEFEIDFGKTINRCCTY